MLNPTWNKEYHTESTIAVLGYVKDGDDSVVDLSFVAKVLNSSGATTLDESNVTTNGSGQFSCELSPPSEGWPCGANRFAAMIGTTSLTIHVDGAPGGNGSLYCPLVMVSSGCP